MHKTRLMLITTMFFLAERAKCQDTTKVGLFVTSIYDLNYSDNSFSADYLIWRINKIREFKEYNLYEPSNAKEVRMVSSSTNWKDQSENAIVKTKGDTLFWDIDEFKATFNHEFNISKYPFDKEILTMDFVSAVYYDDWVKLNLDSLESGLDEITINGWKVGVPEIKKISKSYNTTFGSPGDIRGHVYSGFRVTIPIEREGGLLFLKLFSGLVASFLIALFSLRINITEADGRFGVCWGIICGIS